MAQYFSMFNCLFLITFHWNDLLAGYGVFATKDFEYGEFLLEYAGELIDPGIADTREQTYVFYFSIGKDQYR